MMKGDSTFSEVYSYPNLRVRLADYARLLKIRLTSSVVFSAGAGYLIAADTVSPAALTALILGGFLVVGASNSFNQMWEVERDALMKRTANRPLPAGRMSIAEAAVVSSIALIMGLGLLYSINPLSAFFGLIAVLLYVLAYTPMKARSPWAVFVGAFPGAIPFMLGWVAATNDFAIEPGYLFALQFMWQFPHFWAIGWVAYDDYAKAGYYLLPNRKKDATATRLMMFYTLWMIFLSILPAFGLTGTLTLSVPAAILVVATGVWMLLKAVKLHKSKDDADARKLMIASVIYLPVVQLIYVLDHFINFV